MYIKIFGNYFIPRTSTDARDASSHPIPKIGLTPDNGVSGHKVNDDNDLKPSTQVRMEPMTTLDTTATTQDWLPSQPSSLSGVVVPSLDDGSESPTTTPVLDPLPFPSPVITDLTSALTPSTTSSSSPASTPTYPAPILATPIVQGPAPKGNGTLNAADQPNSQSQSSRPVLSGGAIAAISVVAIMVALALGLWFYRKWSISKRKKKSVDWWLPEPFLIPSNSTAKTPPPMEGKDSQMVWSIPRVRPPSLPLPAIPAYLSAADSGAGAATFSAPRSARVANIGVVRCIFEPRMADELRIRVGEALRVLAEYDDGWGFCENVRGERGMIPLECLEGENLSSVGTKAAGLLNLGQPSFTKSSARKSSLLPKRST